MTAKRLSLFLFIGMTLAAGAIQAHAGTVERIDLKVEGMT
jgi:hypothetical protein